MPTAPDWYLDSGSTVNGEGNVLTINVRLEADSSIFDTTDKVDVVETNAASDLTKFGAIAGWRFQGNTGKLIQTGTTGMVEKAGISGIVGPTNIGGVNRRLTFKYHITLTDAGRIAINDKQPVSGVTIDGLSAAWLVLKWQGGSPGLMSAPAFSTGHASLAFETGKVGRLPPANNGTIDLMRLNVDAHAEAVLRGGGATDLTTWTDLSNNDQDLTGQPTSNEPDLTGGTGVKPHMDFDSAVPNRFQTVSSPVVITSPATIAIAFLPDTDSPTAHLVGRVSSIVGASSWQFYFDGADPAARKVYYKAWYSGGTESVPLDMELGDAAVLVVFVRKQATPSTSTWEAWINGRPVSGGTFAQGVVAGSGPYLVAARGASPTQPFHGELNQVAMYDMALDEFQLSLLMHQMAARAVVDLGTPIPPAWRTQPYAMSQVGTLSPMRLDRRPIAVVKLAGGQLNDNIFGQSPNWRQNDQAAIVAEYTTQIRAALYACDQFEIMFSKPGGQLSQDVVMTDVFGSNGGEQVILADSWAAMSTLWSNLNIAADNDRNNKNTGHYTQRRGWFYTGGGLPLDDAGALDQTGAMRQRFVAPATPGIYKTTILDEWKDKNTRYRCFMLDASAPWFGKFVELVHHADIYPNFVLVGEALPAYNPSNPADVLYLDEYHARLGAPWYSNVEYAKAPWWNVAANGLPDKTTKGYNPSWTNDWLTMPVYFGVQTGAYPNLFNVDGSGDGPGDGNNMSMGYIFKWILKGTAPVSWNADTHAKVGAAWNYATGRVMPSRLIRCPRLIRSIRC